MVRSALNDYLELSGSTTRFLEALSGQPVNACVVTQEECARTSKFMRVSTLHVGKGAPILAASCALNLAALTNQEITRLKKTSDPIGRVLLATMKDDLHRKAVQVTRVHAHPLVDLLAADADYYHLKTFKLWQADRFIGELEELICQESLIRAVQKNCSPIPKTV